MNDAPTSAQADPLSAVDAAVNPEAIGRDGMGCHSGRDAMQAAAAADPAPPGRWGRPPGGERRSRYGGDSYQAAS